MLKNGFVINHRRKKILAQLPKRHTTPSSEPTPYSIHSGWGGCKGVHPLSFMYNYYMMTSTIGFSSC